MLLEGTTQPMKQSYVTITDQFCGAGGSSIGAVKAGAELKLALNHWKLAIDTHNANFPDADHDCTDISAAEPRRYRSTDILVTSPECTNHTISKGVKRTSRQMDMFNKGIIDPSAERSRATMFDVCRFAEHHRYHLIIVENVVEARSWVMWEAWLLAMTLLGYEHQCVYLNSMHAHPTPQSRDRMYVVFWRKGNRAPDLRITPRAYCPTCERDVESVQSWKNPQRKYGKYKQQYVYCCPQCAQIVTPYYYAAANAIDWALPAPRIGDRPRPLKDKTRNRIQIGLNKFGKQSLLVGNYSPGWTHPTTDPTGTVTTSDHHALLTPPFLVDLAYTHSNTDRTTGLDASMPTQTTRQTQGLLVPPFVVKLRGNESGHPITDGLSTVTAGGNHHGLLVPPAFLSSYYGTDNTSPISDAVPTVTTVDRHALITLPFILSYYTRVSGQQAALAGLTDALPTQPTWPLHYLVQPGDIPRIDDCGFRMLQPHEIQKAMGFPDDYILFGTSRDKVKLLGNAVTPDAMTLLTERCLATLR
jgi:DNA (cytosine-5)-methyltransferase 1